MAQSHMVSGSYNAHPTTSHSQYIPAGGTKSYGNAYNNGTTNYTQPNTYSSQYVPTSQPNVKVTRGEPRLVSNNPVQGGNSYPAKQSYAAPTTNYGVSTQPVNRTHIPVTQSQMVQPNVIYSNNVPTTQTHIPVTQSQFLPKSLAGLDMSNLDQVLGNLKRNEENGALQNQLDTLEIQLKKKAIEDEIITKNMERLELETHGHSELKKKHQHTELEVQRMCQNIKFAEENAERLAAENLDLKSANQTLQHQMTQIIAKIQGHFKMDAQNQLISNDEWGLQQEIARLKGIHYYTIL